MRRPGRCSILTESHLSWISAQILGRGFRDEQFEELFEEVLDDLGLAPGPGDLLVPDPISLEEAKWVSTHRGSKTRDNQADRALGSVGNRRWRAAHRASTGRMNQRFLRRKDQFKTNLKRLVRSYWRGDISARQLRQKSSTELKRHYEAVFFWGLQSAPFRKESGSGAESEPSPGSLSAEDRRWIKSAWKQELTHFNKMLDDVIHRGQSQSRTYQRIDRYAEASKSMFDGARIMVVPTLSLIHWSLESSNPCPGCVQLKKWSPFPKDLLPTTPKSGLTPCLHQCYCSIVAKSAKEGEISRRRRVLPSAATMTRTLKRIQKGGR